MVIFLFSCGEETDVEAVEGHLREILKKVNLFMIDILKANAKEEVAVRIVVSLTKAQSSNPLIMDRANYYLKAYEKDTFVVPIDNLARDITKYLFHHLGTLLFMQVPLHLAHLPGEELRKETTETAA
jgi:hypothetical protein